LKLDPMERAPFEAVLGSVGLHGVACRVADDRFERRRVLGRVHRALLVQTDLGRRRLRAWLDAPSWFGDTLHHRRQAIAQSLQYFGDLEALMPIAAALATLPACVIAHVVTTCMVVVTGRTTNGFALSGRLPDRRLIVIAGHRTDDEIVRTFLHEVAHQFLHCDGRDEQPTHLQVAQEIDAAMVREHATPATAHNNYLGFELQADALATAWHEAGKSPHIWERRR
jgi:hypothetical protein